MTNSDVIRYNARVILQRVRGKSKTERHQILNGYRLGVFHPVVQIIAMWRDGKLAGPCQS